MSSTPPRCLRTAIVDRKLSAAFSAARILSGGSIIRFTYPAGLSYDVPTPYVVSWFAEPHYVRVGGRWHEASGGWPSGSGQAFAVRTRLTLDGCVARVYLSNDCAVEVAWDTVLMACEPAYEHFGGFSTRGRTLIFAYWRKWLGKWFGGGAYERSGA